MTKRTLFIFCFILYSNIFKAQSLYFPPITGFAWDTISPQSLNWCQTRIDSLYTYLQVKNTKSFIVLKNGKIVLEKYFGTFTQDSIFYWASAGKSLTGFMTGIAQQKGLININNKVSQYIGTGWSSAILAKEDQITVKHLLQMASGLEDAPPAPCDNEDTAKVCLIYKADAGTRWAYHTGAYKKTQDVISTSAGQSYNSVTQNWIKNKIGLDGFWFDQVYYSRARGMARFGLLNLNKGIWGNDTILKDSLYFKNMISTSQNYNLAYGYLWWLNGKNTIMNPGLQLVLNGPLIPNAPADLYAALGKNDQKIYVVPSQGLVVIRQGYSAEGVTFALSNFDNKLWEYLNKLNCGITALEESEWQYDLKVFPNPVKETLTIHSNVNILSVTVINNMGESDDLILVGNKLDISKLKKGLYILRINTSEYTGLYKKIVID